MRAHVEGCVRCQAVLAELARSDQHFDAAVFPHTAPAVLRRRAQGRRLLAFSLGPLVLAAAAVVLFVRAQGPDDAGDGTRSKGPSPLQPLVPSLEIYARRGELLLPLVAGNSVARGDQLRFVVQRPSTLKYALVLSLTGDGGAVVYHPVGGTVATELHGIARRIELPGGVAVDARPGPERIFLLMDQKSFSLTTILPALERAGGVDADERQAALPVAAVVSIRLERAPTSR